MSAHESIGDALLQWSSEVGSGQWADFREAAAYVNAERGGTLRPASYASDLSALGHLDVDWARSRWSAAPACLAVAPGLGLCAYLAGWRTASFLRRFDEETVDLDIYPFSISQGMGPPALFAKCGSVEALERLGERLHIPVVFDPGDQLVDFVEVRGLSNEELASAPPLDEPVEFFEPQSLTWLSVSERAEDGMYRFDLYGRKVFRVRRVGSWYSVDRSAGQLGELSGRQDVMAWHPPSTNLRTPRVLAVRSEISLPPVAERAAVAASGLLPFRKKGWRLFRNVPRQTATRLADALDLELNVESKPFEFKERPR